MVKLSYFFLIYFYFLQLLFELKREIAFCLKKQNVAAKP